MPGHRIFLRWGLCGLLGVLALTGCRWYRSNGAPVVTHALPEDFADTADVAVRLADGLRLDLWAPTSLLASPVALSFDDRGVAYVAETERRKTSDLDIRAHPAWMTDDLSLRSLDDTEAFLRRVLSPARSDSNAWLDDLNRDGRRDWHDLTVEQERVRRILDTDGDGRADASNIFARGFDGLLTGVAAGVLAYDGALYLTVAPDLWRLRDGDGDGDADERTVLSHGYGIHIGFAGHDLSGLTAGPDGRIYWAIGDLGLNVTGPDGRRWVYPHQGAVLRANPDGTGFEVFAAGLRNPQELAFDAYGNLFTVDNDGDFPGEHERVVYLVEGSDSGWRSYWQYGKYDRPGEAYNVWMDEGLSLPAFPGQPAYIVPPLAPAHDGPAGLAFNPGTALGDAWDGYFFVSYFTGTPARSRIHAFRVAPRGAAFVVTEDREILRGIQATGLTFGPDGALYLADWLEGWDKKPVGRIWRLDVTDTTRAVVRAETRRMLAEGLRNRSTDALATLLAHPDQRVRMAAQFELVRRDAEAVLLATAGQSPHRFARLHGLWGLGQLARRKPARAAALLPFLTDPDAEVRAQAAGVLGEARHAPALTPLIERLHDDDARVQRYAAEALGRLGDRRAFSPLVHLLAGDAEAHLRHTVTLALARLGDPAALVGCADDPVPAVRLGAVVALRRLHAPGVAVFLNDPDPRVVTEAARAIHDDESIPEALPMLARAVRRGAGRDEAFVRRAVNANLRLGDAASARRLATVARDATAPEALRVGALRALGAWPAPPRLDPVEGRYRVPGPHDPEDARRAFSAVAAPLFAAPAVVRAAAVETAGRLADTTAAPAVLALATDPAQPAPVRRAALQALLRLDQRRLVEALDPLLTDDTLRTEAHALLTRLDLPPGRVVALLTTVLEKGTLAEQQNALATLGTLHHEAAERLLVASMERLLAGTLPPELHLDVLQAAARYGSEALTRQRARYEARLGPDPVSQFREVRYGGDATRGKALVYRHPSAQCLKCHAIRGVGGTAGPDLSHIGAVLSRTQLLEALVAPGARLAPGFGPAMPDMTSLLSRTEIRDVIAFLATLQ